MAPALTSIAPTSGPVAGLNSVTLTGTGFVNITAVRFGATPASYTVDSGNQITATAPPGSGTVQVTVVATPGGTSNGLPYTYIPVPSLSGIGPDRGPTTGGTSVTLTGTGLTGATAVTFGATPATSFTVVSDTQITATAPAGSGTAQVTVTTPGGLSNGVSYTYVLFPVITSIDPTAGPTAGSNTVTLTGSGFVNVTAVRFGTVAAAFEVDSGNQITVIAPPGSGTVQVTVTTIAGVSNGVPYTYVTAPVLTSLDPTTGPEAGGTTVVLTGTGLAGATAVSFGGTPATSFTVVSDSQIIAIAPAGVGVEQVTVTTVGGTSNGLPYTYAVIPAISAADPDEGPVVGGTSVVLTGTGFTGATAVEFGGTP
ncbi:IPT/TIG domain-containing protein, partial [Nocardia shimofusensis]|uniref:IPT/TIG domain-containing protein n=1 Tax=Nocardia shimofusensis TaxID=228596 RepID=UPI00082DE56A